MLAGTVLTFTSLGAAADDALHVPGVKAVRNELRVGFPDEITAPDDTEIENRIKSMFSWHENLKDFDFNINVENGWVNLEGAVDSYWKKVQAAELA